MTDRPTPLCLIDEHELICWCGDSYPHGFDGHQASVYGCCRCDAGPTELKQQEQTKGRYDD